MDWRGKAMEPDLVQTPPTAVVLGASHWHADLYREGLARRFNVATVQDDDETAARRFAGTFGASVTTSVDDALNTVGVDVAFVFSPHHRMLAIAQRLVDLRIPFVVEKPAAADLAELSTLAQTARLAGVPIAVPLVQRGAPIDTWLRQAGDIVYERMAFVAGPADRYRSNGNPWMLDPALSGGGSLMNLGPHFVDMAIAHLGRPARVSRHVSTTMHSEAVDDHGTLILTTSTGREAIVEVGYAFPDSALKRYCSFSATGSKGFASIDTTGAASFTDVSGVTTTADLQVDSDPLYEGFVDGVADTLASGFAGMPSVDDLLLAMEIIWAPGGEGVVSRG